MIITVILNLLKTLLFTCFSWISLPALPTEIMQNVDTFLGLIFDNLTLLGFFIRPTTLKLVIPVLIIVLNFDNIYKFTMWILKKIPALNIH